MQAGKVSYVINPAALQVPLVLFHLLLDPLFVITFSCSVKTIFLELYTRSLFFNPNTSFHANIFMTLIRKSSPAPDSAPACQCLGDIPPGADVLAHAGLEIHPFHGVFFPMNASVLSQWGREVAQRLIVLHAGSHGGMICVSGTGQPSCSSSRMKEGWRLPVKSPGRYRHRNTDRFSSALPAH